MKKRTEIAEILRGSKKDGHVVVMGWVRSFRNSQFVALNDGSCLATLQIVVNPEVVDAETLSRITVGASVCFEGKLVESQGKGQAVEVIAESVEIFGDCDPSAYPFQAKNRPSLEFLREQAHLRIRTNVFGAVFRIRHALQFAIHKFYNDKAFFNLHSPIITASDAEGAGEMFHVTTLNAANPPLKNATIDKWANEFWGKMLVALKDCGEDVIEIDKNIKLYLEDYSLEKIVKATPADIAYLVKEKNIKEVDKIILRIYALVKSKLFDVDNPQKAKLPHWLFEKLNVDKSVLRLSKTRESLPLGYDYLKKDFGSFSLTFYNFSWVARYNRLSKLSELDYSKDFFKRPANLTVSGQLEGELFAMGLSKVYTFGPTFRAENSNTLYHLAEFWMIEPEVAFADLTDNMDLAEEMLKYCTKYALENCREDLNFLAERFANEEKEKPQADRQELGLIEKLEFVLANPFERLDYTQAIEILKESKPFKKGQFKFPVEWGIDLQKEHERYLVEKHFKKPVILINYPKDIKAFYMRQNDDGKTVAAMDVLFPYVGEIIGGSQREERLDKLTQRMREMHIPEKEMFWFLDTRRFGTCPHAGFGLGFERMMLFLTGMTNIRDVIPFPRYPGNAEF
jgi:aspartyl/asparaginyl-tRNA synthetase